MGTTAPAPRSGAAGATLALGLLLAGCDVPQRAAAPTAPAAGPLRALAGGLASGASYRLVSAVSPAGSPRCLDVASSRAASGTNVQLYTCNSTAAQRWTVTEVAGGFATLRSAVGTAGAAFCLDAAGGGLSAGTNVQIATCTGGRPQNWQIAANGDGTFTLRAQAGDGTASNVAVDVAGSNPADGTNVQLYPYFSASNNAQKWRIERVDGGATPPPGGALPAPPATIVDNIRPGGPVVRRVFYDDTIAVYFGDGLNTSATWMVDHVKRSWVYIRKTYGSFGPDPRIYVVAHANTAYNYATVNTRFDAGFGYRNVIDLGGAWDWSRPQQVNYEVMTHELAHIVEGGGKDTKESPSFEVWRDGPWPEIAVYDIYRGIGQAAWAQDWYNRMIPNRNGSYSPLLTGQYFTFRDWFYPIYSQYGGTAVLNRYFTLLSQCFPKKTITVGGGQTALEYARRANVGEFVHFWSGAAGANLKARFTTAYTWNSTIEGQFQQAQRDFACANNYPK